jgi:hypothetical protein
MVQKTLHRKFEIEQHEMRQFSSHLLVYNISDLFHTYNNKMKNKNSFNRKIIEIRGKINTPKIHDDWRNNSLTE